MQHEYVKFLTVVEEGSFNLAANKLHITQPALSIAIKNLEKELGAQLLYRSPRGVKLTEAGEVVYKQAKIMRRTKKNLLSRLGEELKSAKTLKLGVIDSIGRILIDSQNLAPKINLELIIDRTNHLIESLRIDKIDMAFVSMSKSRNIDEVQLEPLGKEKFSLVCAPGIEGAVIQDINQSATINNFLSYDKHSNTNTLMRRCFKDLGLKVEGSFYSTNPDLIRLMALHGKGVALLPDSTIRQNLKNDTLIKLKAVAFSRPIASATLVGKYISDDMTQLKENVKKGLQ